MLVITRRVGETVLIGSSLRVTVDDLSDGVAALRFTGLEIGGDDHGEPVHRLHLLRRDEAANCGRAVNITLLAIDADRCSLGIVAPGDFAVHREEVYEAIQKEWRDAADGSSGRGAH